MDEYLYIYLGSLGLSLIGLKFLSRSLQGVAETYLNRILKSQSNSFINPFFLGSTHSLFFLSPFSNFNFSISYLISGYYTIPKALLFAVSSYTTSFLFLIFLSLNVGNLDLFLIGIGAIPFISSKDQELKNSGLLFFSLGLLFHSVRLPLVTVTDGFVIQGILSHYFNSLPTLVFFCFMALIPILFIVVSIIFKSITALLIFVSLLLSNNIIDVNIFYLSILGILISPFFSNLKLFTESNQNKVKTFLISKYMIGIFLLVINFIFAKSNLHFMNILDLKINYKFFNQLLFPFLIIILFGFFQFLVVILIAKPILYFSDKVIFPKIKKEKQKLSLPEELIDVPTVLSLQHLKDEVLKQLAMIQSFTSDLKEVFKEKKVKKDNNKRILKYKTIIKNFNLEFNQYVTNLSQQELMYSQRKELEKTKLIQSEASKILYDIFDLYTIIETCLSSDVFKEEKYSYEYLKSYIISIERSFEMLFELSYEETNIANQKKEYMAFNREVKYSIFVHSENDKITQALFSIYLLMKDIEKSMTNLNHLLAR